MDPAPTPAPDPADDPLVMWLVVRHSASDPATTWWRRAWEGVLAANERFAEDPAHAEWARTRFRKVVLRAKGSEWERLLEEEHDALVVEDALAVLRARRRSTAPREVSRLNVCRWTMDDLPGDTLADGGDAPTDGAWTCLVRASLTMGVGKQMAQVAHGAMLAAQHLRLPRDAPVLFRFADDEEWRAAAEATAPAAQVVVRDAGFTEVEPGSETVRVISARR